MVLTSTLAALGAFAAASSTVSAAVLPNLLPRGLVERTTPLQLTGVPQFLLQTEAEGKDDAGTNGRYIATFHSGAGMNEAVATDNTTQATPFSAQNGLIDFVIGQAGHGPNMTYAFGLQNASAYLSNAPHSYNIVSVDATDRTYGFSVVNDTVENSYPVFKGFAVCHVNATAPYVSAGPQYQLFWKNSSSVASAPNCTDVKLKTVLVKD